MSIEYKKSGLDETVLRLLAKLEPDFPVRSLVKDIENEHITVNKVFYDGKLYGILVLRGIINRKGAAVLVIDHAVAEDHVAIHFGNIIAESIQQTAKKHGFLKVRQHAHKLGLVRMLEKFYGSPREWVFEIDVDEPHLQRKEQCGHTRQEHTSHIDL